MAPSLPAFCHTAPLRDTHSQPDPTEGHTLTARPHWGTHTHSPTPLRDTHSQPDPTEGHTHSQPDPTEGHTLTARPHWGTHTHSPTPLRDTHSQPDPTEGHTLYTHSPTPQRDTHSQPHWGTHMNVHITDRNITMFPSYVIIIKAAVIITERGISNTFHSTALS